MCIMVIHSTRAMQLISQCLYKYVCMAAVNYSNILKNVKAITKSKYSEYEAYFLLIYYHLVA